MSFLNLLKKDPDARKIFGEREIKIIEKQLYGVSLSQSEKNRLSRDIRVKFDFIQKLSPYSNFFKLKKGFEIDRIIDFAKEDILDDKLGSKVKEIILFGSVVDNKLTLDSDIDIAIKIDGLSNSEQTELRIRLLGRVSERVDIQIYDFLPSKLKKEVDSKGKVLYIAKNT